MSGEEKPRRPSAEVEREARRLGWFPGCVVTWREFLEQYPYGREEIQHHHAMSDAA